MNIQEFMKTTYKTVDIDRPDFHYSYTKIRPFLWCKDGNGVSVQGSENHYSSPRMNGYQFSKFECGYPTVRPPENWRKYSEQDWNDLGFVGKIKRAWSQITKAFGSWKSNKWTFKNYLRNTFTDSACDTIYPYIPIKLVQEFIDIHGGIDEVKTFEKWQE